MKRTCLYICLFATAFSILGCTSCDKRQKPAEETPEKESPLIPDYSKDPRAIRLMTYNVGVFGKFTDNSIPLVADLIKEARPDIVGLNELDSCNRRHNIYQLEELNTCLGKDWNFVFQSMFAYQGGGYGVGIETTRKITGTRSYDIPKTPGVRHMGVLAVETEDFVFMSTHLNTSGSVSLSQAQLINEYVRKDYWMAGKPVFLAGDMNSRPDSATMEELNRELRQHPSPFRLYGA